jgi:hypothetical protein
MRIERMKTALLLIALASMAACSSTAHVTVQRQFPAVVFEPREISASLVFDQEFQSYVAHPNENTSIDIGSSQVDLLSKAFRGLFNQVEVVNTRETVGEGTELVIIPSVREVQLSTPSDSYLNVYEVWIKYNLDIETADGVPVDSWFMPAYGKTPDSFMLSRTDAIEEATNVALRDAGAKLLLDFFRIPSVYSWMEQQNQQDSQAVP